MRLAVLVTVVVALTGCVNNSTKQGMDYVNMTKEQALSLTRVKDDDLENVAQINTQEVFREKRGLVGIVWDDNFLRAYINKDTGETVYQVYDRVYMKDWSYLYQVNYSSPDGPQTRKLIRVASDVETCSSNAFIGCTLREDVAWNVDREMLETVAALYSPGVMKAWKYKLKGQSGEDRIRGFTATEVAALLEKVDQYKQRNTLPTETATKSNIKPLDPDEREFGKQSITAERYAKQEGCRSSDGTTAQGFMIIRDYNVETYQFQCESGDLLVRCDAGVCETL